MARWITQALHVSPVAEITLFEDWVKIGDPCDKGPAFFEPETRDDANAMAIALRLAAKRLEDIGKGLS